MLSGYSVDRYTRYASMDMISMDIHGKSADVDMDMKFHVHGKPNKTHEEVIFHLFAGNSPSNQIQLKLAFE